MKKLVQKMTFLAVLATVGLVDARIIRISGNGTGGTTVGDKEAACERAYERAERDADRQCYDRDGESLGLRQDECHCRRKPGSRDDYTCEAEVTLQCDVLCRPSQIMLSGSGLGIDYNRNQACNDATRRAEDDNYISCQQREGIIVSSNELSCNCRRLSGGDYECRSTVQSSCEVNLCR